MKSIIKWLLLMIILFTISTVTVKGNVFFVDAQGAIVIEKDSKRILYQKNGNQQFLTASIAKIMTAIVVIENTNIDSYVKVDVETTRQTGSSIYLALDDELTIIDLLYGMMLRSGNDAAYLLAKSVTGDVSDFIKLMNDKAKELKLISTVFTNPTGLDEDTQNYSTPLDMATLMAYCLENETFKTITKTKSYTAISKAGNKYYFTNKHKLVLGTDFVTGGKTGYTTNAKRTLVTSATKNGMTLIAVTFKCSDDWNQHLAMFEYGFNNYTMKTLIKRQIIDVEDFYPVTPYIPASLRYPMRENEKADIIIYLLKNPKNERIIGKATLYIDNIIKTSVDVYRYY